MARFPDQFVNQVADATDIVDVVGQFVALTKRGKEFVGLCPFHEDHRPSMYVSPSKQIFKCFACGAGGGVFQFLMQLQKMPFPEAVRELADRAGIPVPAQASPPPVERGLSGEALVEVATFAGRFYRDRLQAADGADALAYARGRGLSDESIRRFGLGYAPASWDALAGAARQAGLDDRQLVAAGLAAQREDGSIYDRFRNRLIFPILSVTGKVIAFGGRALDPDERAKYLNSPETVLFDKSANLYALNWARQPVSQSGQAIVVEGYLDALMCHQAGLANVAATLGTALTARHVRLLARYAREVVLVFDADTAGQTAMERAIELFLGQRLNVRVAVVPAGAGPEGQEVKDPCDYVLATGAEAMRQLVAGAPDALQYAWSRRREAYQQAETLAQKRAIVDDFLRLVVSSAAGGAIDSLRLGLLSGHLAELIGLSPADVTDQMRRLARRVPRASAPAADAAPAATEGSPADRAEEWVLGALVAEPELFPSVEQRLAPAMFAHPTWRAVAEQVWKLAEAGRLELSALLLAEESDRWGRVVTDLHLAAERRGNHRQTLADAAEDIARRRRRDALRQQKAQGDLDPGDLLRKLAQEGRRPDRRRRPRIP